jgi:hypothetical protein
MAPELLKGDQYDAKIDLFSFGVVLYELCEKKKPYPGIKSVGDLHNTLFVKKEKPKFSDKTSTACKNLIKKCLDMDPSKRPTASEAADYIRHHIEDLFPGTRAARVKRYERWAEQQFEAMAAPVTGPAHVFAKKEKKPAKPAKEEKPPPPELVEALRHPGKREFLDAVVKIAGEMRSHELTALLPTILPYFDAEDYENVQMVLLEAICYFGGRSRHIVQPLVDAGFYLKMPITKDTIPQVIDLLCDVMTHAAASFTVEYARPIAQIAAIAPDSALALLGYCIHSLARPLALELHIEVAEQAVMDLSASPVSAVLIRRLAELGAQDGEAGPRAGRAAASFLGSPHEETVLAAYRCAVQLCSPPPPVSEVCVFAHLGNDRLRTAAYDYLARLPQIEASLPVLNALVSRSQDPASWLLLGKMAGSPAGAVLLLANVGWIEQENVKEVLRLFVLLATDPAKRRPLAALPHYAPFLKAAASLGDDQALSAVAVIVGRCEVSEDALKRLAGQGFWRVFVDAVKRSKTVEVHQNTILLLMHFFRMGWVEEFADYVTFATGMLSSPELANGVIQLLLRLSYVKEGAALILELIMVEYFERLRANEFYRVSAERILNNVTKAN